MVYRAHRERPGFALRDFFYIIFFNVSETGALLPVEFFIKVHVALGCTLYP